MKIVQLSVENVKRVKAVSIAPEAPVVVVGGKNGAGKSSVLDAIAMALGGSKLACPKPLRTGTKKGKVTVDLGDLVVTRTFTEGGGGTLVVANQDGARYPSPQAVLDKIIGTLTFDPLAFARMKAKEQEATLRALVGIDTTALDAEAKTVFDERTAVNRTVKALEAQVAALPDHADVPAEEVSMQALAGNLERIAAVERVAVAAETESRRAMEASMAGDEKVSRRKAIIAKLGADLARERAALAVDEGAAREAHERALEKGQALLAAKAAVPDPALVRSQLATAEATNAKVRANRVRAEKVADLQTQQARAAALTARLESLATETANLLAAVTFPVAGLGLDDTGVTFNGEPFAQASLAEQIRVSVAMGLALNPTLKVLMIREGSALDTESLRLVAEMAAAADAQVWVEKVAELGEGVSVLIEDGAVAAVAAVA